MAITTDTDNALLSLGDAVVYLGMGTTTGADSSSDSDTIRDVINTVSWRFNSETGRKLKARDYTEVYDGNGESSLHLSGWPIASTTITICINATRTFGGTTTDQVTDTDVMLSTAEGLVRLDGWSFTEGIRNVQVEYTGGYSTSDSYDLTNAAKDFLLVLWNRQTAKEPVNTRTEAYEGISRTFEPDFPWSVLKVLNMYREGQAY